MRAEDDVKKCMTWRRSIGLVCCHLLLFIGVQAQQSDEPGHSIGKISTSGGLVVMELDANALGAPNLFNLAGHTLRFTPDGLRYRIENTRLRWDSDYGNELRGAQVSLHRFAFPFSGRSWNTFLVGVTGSIRFAAEKDDRVDPYGKRDGGVILDRFDQLADIAGKLGNQGPAICVFLKPRLVGPRYVKELPDRVVITWDLTEPFGSLLDFGWTKTTNRFQAVLHSDGLIEMSYQEMTAKDAIVGVYPAASSDAQPVPVHLSYLTRNDGPFAGFYEAFHYLAVPKPQDLSCTVIRALGDKFDFLAYYSDFRIDSQEASSPSDGPIGGNITGIGDTQHDQTQEVLESRCTRGRFQLGFAQPIYVGSNEAQAGPPAGAPAGNGHNITFYMHQLAEASPDGKPRPYNYAVGHLGHEVGHRWSAYVGAKVNG